MKNNPHVQQAYKNLEVHALQCTCQIHVKYIFLSEFCKYLTFIEIVDILMRFVIRF